MKGRFRRIRENCGDIAACHAKKLRLTLRRIVLSISSFYRAKLFCKYFFPCAIFCRGCVGTPKPRRRRSPFCSKLERTLPQLAKMESHSGEVKGGGDELGSGDAPILGKEDTELSPLHSLQSVSTITSEMTASHPHAFKFSPHVHSLPEGSGPFGAVDPVTGSIKPRTYTYDNTAIPGPHQPSFLRDTRLKESSPEKSENFAENSGNFPEKENFPEESKKNSENYSQKSQNSPDKINQGEKGRMDMEEGTEKGEYERGNPKEEGDQGKEGPDKINEEVPAPSPASIWRLLAIARSEIEIKKGLPQWLSAMKHSWAKRKRKRSPPPPYSLPPPQSKGRGDHQEEEGTPFSWGRKGGGEEGGERKGGGVLVGRSDNKKMGDGENRRPTEATERNGNRVGEICSNRGRPPLHPNPKPKPKPNHTISKSRISYDNDERKATVTAVASPIPATEAAKAVVEARTLLGWINPKAVSASPLLAGPVHVVARITRALPLFEEGKRCFNTGHFTNATTLFTTALAALLGRPTATLSMPPDKGRLTSLGMYDDHRIVAGAWTLLYCRSLANFKTNRHQEVVSDATEAIRLFDLQHNHKNAKKPSGDQARLSKTLSKYIENSRAFWNTLEISEIYRNLFQNTLSE
ncbi:hypothetical protein AAMO2058_001675900 [Amorphochlora amoebiformis]